MKLTALLLTIFFLQVHASGSAQSVTISGKDLSLAQVFAAIKQQTGYVVFYNRNMLAGTKPVSLTARNMPLQELLDVVFREQPVAYVIQDKTIILSRKKSPAAQTQPLISVAEGTPVSGRVVDQDNQPLPGVTIRVKGSNKGVTAGMGGMFTLHVNEGDELQVTAIGYETITIRLAGENFLVLPAAGAAGKDKPESQSILIVSHISSPLIRLGRATSMLDEVQIVPYGVTSRRFATGSIAGIKGKDIEKQPVTTVLQALEGRVPGLNLTALTGNSAAPVRVEIRGRRSLNPMALSDPLYVIDGVPQNILEINPIAKREVSIGFTQSGFTNTPGENPLLYLNPGDIESIDVLKDADATAIYGSRAANGVILITTKKNKPGPTRFSVSISRGTTSVPRYLPLMNTPEYLAMRREAFLNDRMEPTIYNAQDLMLWDSTRYTDWQRDLIGTGNQLAIDAKLTGGLVQTSYTIGVSHYAQTELQNNNGKTKRSSFFVNLGHTSLNQKLSVNVVSRLSATDVEAYSISGITGIPPNAPAIYAEPGEFNFVPWRGQWNSLFPLSGLKKPSESKTHALTNSLSIRYELLRGLTLTATAGYNYTQNDNANYTPAASYDAAFFALSSAFFGNSSNRSWTAEPRLEYNTHIGKGDLSVQVGGNLQEVLTKGNTAVAQGFPNDNLIRSVNNASFVMNIDAMGEYRYAALFGILNYRWDNKYVLNLNARRDGSSRFGPGKQFGNFGSVGLAWIASEEKWIRNNLPSWISFVKLRSSYGITGRDGIGDYEYLSRWSSATSLGGGADKLFEYNGVPAFHIVRPLNQRFQWETTAKFDAALQLGFFDDKVNLEAIYYRERSGNQLTAIPTPAYTGFTTVTANWGAVIQNSGLEASLMATLLRTKDWMVSATFNFSMNRNELADYPGLESSPYANTYFIGKSLQTQYLLRYTGIDPLTGDYTFEDHNKDGSVQFENVGVPRNSWDDRYIEIDLNPKYMGGFGTDVNYRGIGLSANFIYKRQTNKDPFLTLELGRMANGLLPAEVAENHWRNPGDKALYPKYTVNGNLNRTSMALSDGGYTDASYVKLSTLTLSYNIPDKILQKIKMQSCRLSVQTQNLFTITSFKGIDPEVLDLNSATPIPRIITTNLLFNF
ncbi:SusC/RagA family TonB-linked outer membrane protein [Chitinophaga sp. YIM B06452]|uniref:SusC/RagA family TonB-linked outer membrane protein n=1 Tax=Chitinophaga sp. YIM B06452 TaxID=3082158 RepID=UPI0031FF3FB5